MAYRVSGRQSCSGAPNEALVAGDAFSPTDVAGGFVWIDMQDPAAYSAPSGVASVTNKFSSVVWSEASNRPTLSATGLNGFPCIDFNGVGDRIMSTEAAVVAAFSDQLDYYLAMVVQADDLDAIEVIFGTGNSGQAGAGSKRWGTNTTSTGRWTAIGTNDAAVGTVVDSTGATVNTPVLLEFYSESAATSIRVNGGSAAPSGSASAYGTLTPDRFAIGCRPSSSLSTFFDGRVGEILAYGLTSDSDKALVRAYLIDKWNIS